MPETTAPHDPDTAGPDATIVRRGQRTLLLIAAICVLPLLAAVWYRFFAPPPTVATVGEMLAPTPFPLTTLVSPSGAPLDATRIGGHWLMLQTAPAACDEPCRQALYLSRQVRMAQAKAMDRITRVWLLADAGEPSPELLAQHPDLVLARFSGPAAHPLASGDVYLVDRRGFLVFRYAAGVDPVAFIKELGKLVKF